MNERTNHQFLMLGPGRLTGGSTQVSRQLAGHS